MRVRLTWLGAGCLAVMTGWLSGSEPDGKTLPTPRPLDEVRKLQHELEALAAEREAARTELAERPSLVSERTKLRSDILELIKKIGEKKTASEPARPATVPPTAHATPTASPAPMPMPTPQRPSFLLDDPARTIDPLRKAQNMYKAGYTDAALEAFYLLDLERLPREDRTFAYYMSACYLRSQGKTAEAAVRFREIADAKDDPLLTESAISQIEIINKSKELETLVEQLRSRQKSK